jgi:copper chaperone CopZ
MKRNALIVPAVLGVLCLATSAWAGGASCSGKAEGTASKTGAHCTMGASKEMAAGGHCSGVNGASMTSKGQCPFGASNAVFSFAVKDAHCGACVEKIQSAALAQKGVLCAKVDLNTKTAYIAGDKNLDQRMVAKAIKNAGFTCALKDQGPKARAEFVKLMASSPASPAPKKEKV